MLSNTGYMQVSHRDLIETYLIDASFRPLILKSKKAYNARAWALMAVYKSSGRHYRRAY